MEAYVEGVCWRKGIFFLKKLFLRNLDSRMATNLRNSSTGIFLRRKLYASDSKIFSLISRVQGEGEGETVF